MNVKEVLDTITKRLQGLMESLDRQDLRQFGMLEGLKEALDVVGSVSAMAQPVKMEEKMEEKMEDRPDSDKEEINFIELMWGTDEVPTLDNEGYELAWTQVIWAWPLKDKEAIKAVNPLFISGNCIAIPVKSTEVNYKSLWGNFRSYVVKNHGVDLGEGYLLKREVPADRGMLAYYPKNLGEVTGQDWTKVKREREYINGLRPWSVMESIILGDRPEEEDEGACV
jgi:hypothetical protein